MKEQEIDSIVLMRRAAKVYADKMRLLLANKAVNCYYIFCGPGNNGGDGIGIAENLSNEGEKVVVVLCYNNKPCSMESHIMLQMLRDKGDARNYTVVEYNKDLHIGPHDVVVDAMFGMGLDKPLGRYYISIVTKILMSEALIFAVDVPSGMFLDSETPAETYVIHAHYTLTFQYMKFAFLQPQNARFIGKLHILDIGLVLTRRLTNNTHVFQTAEEILPLLKQPKQFDHKGVNGHGLLIAGSVFMPGSAILAAKGAVRGGIGKLTVHTVPTAAFALTPALPEALISCDMSSHFLAPKAPMHILGADAVAIGPGIGYDENSAELLKSVIEMAKQPLVLDADALNIMEEHRSWLSKLPRYTIITPHWREFERLFGEMRDHTQRLQTAQKKAKSLGIIIIVKGAYTCIAMPSGDMYFNSTGNPGMATAGSGDVLTGLLLALLAKGYRPQEAARIGVYLHGLAGDIAAKKYSYEGLIASDIADALGAAHRVVRG